MTNYTRKSFSVGSPHTKSYGDNWERTFRSAEVPEPKLSPPTPPVDMNALPRETSSHVRALFDAAEMVDNVPHHAAAALSVQIRELAHRLAREALTPEPSPTAPGGGVT